MVPGPAAGQAHGEPQAFFLRLSAAISCRVSRAIFCEDVRSTLPLRRTPRKRAFSTALPSSEVPEASFSHLTSVSTWTRRGEPDPDLGRRARGQVGREGGAHLVRTQLGVQVARDRRLRPRGRRLLELAAELRHLP